MPSPKVRILTRHIPKTLVISITVTVEDYNYSLGFSYLGSLSYPERQIAGAGLRLGGFKQKVRECHLGAVGFGASNSFFL